MFLLLPVQICLRVRISHVVPSSLCSFLVTALWLSQVDLCLWMALPFSFLHLTVLPFHLCLTCLCLWFSLIFVLKTLWFPPLNTSLEATVFPCTLSSFPQQVDHWEMDPKSAEASLCRHLFRSQTVLIHNCSRRKSLEIAKIKLIQSKSLELHRTLQYPPIHGSFKAFSWSHK